MTELLLYFPMYIKPHAHIFTHSVLMYPQTHAFPSSPQFADTHIEQCNWYLFLLMQICQCSLLIKQFFSPFYSPRHPHILPKQTYWLGFQGRMRTTEQLQTLGASVESLTDVYSQLVVFAVLNFWFLLLLWGCINGMASAILYTAYPHFFPARVPCIHHLSVSFWGEKQKITPSTDDSVMVQAIFIYSLLCVRNTVYYVWGMQMFNFKVPWKSSKDKKQIASAVRYNASE